MIDNTRAMSAERSRIWVVITDGNNTRLCSSDDGAAMPIHSPVFDAKEEADDYARDLRACEAWFKAEHATRPTRNPRRQHLVHVSQLLSEAAREAAYDGLIIIATDPAATELNEALSPDTRALLIGRVIRDFAGQELTSSCCAQAFRH
jgi:hypothetical protein